MDLIKNLLNPDPSSSSQKIYTTGFHGREVTDLSPLLRSLEAVLVDIRFAPEAMPLKWSRQYLKLLLKNRYLHVPSLGNRSHEEGKVAIQNLGLGIKIITDLNVNLLLMCKCENEGVCHRRAIRSKLNERGIETEELKDWVV